MFPLKEKASDFYEALLFYKIRSDFILANYSNSFNTFLPFSLSGFNSMDF